MTSIDDVARRADVSPITVSRVVNNHPSVRPATRERVRQAIAELNYIPNAVARGLKQSRSGLIALIVTNLSSPFFVEVARGADDAVRASGRTLIIINSNDVPDNEASVLQTVGEHRVDGIILVPTPEAANGVAGRIPKSIPLVLLDWKAPGLEADLVRCDTWTGTYTLCRHLIEQGRRRIAMIGGSPDSPNWLERVGGYRAALNEAGIAASDDDIIPGTYRFESGIEIAAELLGRSIRPDAIVTANAQVAWGVLDRLGEAGIRIPEEIAVGSVDNPLPHSVYWSRLPVVEQPGYEMGKAAVELVIERLDCGEERPPREIVFPAKVIVPS
jgi:LacI family transcriptional regulator